MDGLPVYDNAAVYVTHSAFRDLLYGRGSKKSATFFLDFFTLESGLPVFFFSLQVFLQPPSLSI
jgi:nucleoid-associated protein YejK